MTSTRGRAAALPAVAAMALAGLGPPASAVPTPQSQVVAWGQNVYLQLGDEKAGLQRGYPGRVCRDKATMDNTCAPLSGVADVEAGRRHSLALFFDGTVRAWGNTQHGTLGNGVTGNSTVSTPQVVCQVDAEEECGQLTGVQDISTSEDHNLAVVGEGSIVAWGRNGNGKLGNKSTLDAGVPVHACRVGQAPCQSGARTVSAGKEHSLALLNDGQVLAWGSNVNGQLATYSTIKTKQTPTEVDLCPEQKDKSGCKAIAIAAGGAHSAAVLVDGTVRTWGANQHGQLGDGSMKKDNQYKAIPVTLVEGKATAVAAGDNHTVVLLEDGTLMAWGHPGGGRLGDGIRDASVRQSRPRWVCAGPFVQDCTKEKLRDIEEIDANDNFTVARDVHGTVFTWGGTEDGKLGREVNGDEAFPVPVQHPDRAQPTLTRTTRISAGERHVLALSDPYYYNLLESDLQNPHLEGVRHSDDPDPNNAQQQNPAGVDVIGNPDNNGKGWHVRHLSSGECLDVYYSSNKPGANLVRYPCDDNKQHQQFKLEKHMDGYRLIAVHSGLCLTAPGKERTALTQQECESGKKEQLFTPIGDLLGSYQLKLTHHREQCLDVVQLIADTSPNVVQQKCDGSFGQRWAFYQ